jgi:hypothetical protein
MYFFIEKPCGSKKCPENEEFNINKPSCPPDSCASLVARYDCSKAPPPKPGCQCKSGYKRLNNRCVPLCECPQIANTSRCRPTCNDPNEEYVEEKNTCPGDTCRSLLIKIDCSKAPPRKPGCQCKSGFLRKGNATAPCVPICECPNMASSSRCSTTTTGKYVERHWISCYILHLPFFLSRSSISPRSVRFG